MTTPTVDQLSDTLHDKEKIHRTMLHAEYWRNAARSAVSAQEQWVAHDCALNSWKNLAVSLSEELKRTQSSLNEHRDALARIASISDQASKS